jgi:uncharacterized RDD family membrane protein YckC
LSVPAENRRVVHFVTPENIEVTYELAGIGSRFVAAFIDHLIQGFAILFIFVIAGQLSSLFSLGGIFGRTASIWLQALAGLLAFVIMFGYFVFFELRSGGQTPGKRFAKLRVVRDGGHPIDPYSSVIRNLVRIADLAIPPPYGAGMISIFASREYKRLGDFAAGTIVIKERVAPDPPPATLPEPLVAQLMPFIRDLDQLTPSEYQAIRRFVERRNSLPYHLQVDYAMRLALPLMSRLGISVAIADQSHYPALVEAIDRRYTEERGLSRWEAEPQGATPEF